MNDSSSDISRSIKNNKEAISNDKKDSNIDSEKDSKKQSFFERITDFSDWDKTTWVYVIIFLVLMLLTAYLFYKMYLDQSYLFGLVIRYFVAPVSKMGTAGWTIFLIFMAIQGMLVPIPSELVLLSSGMIWGLVTGTILGIIGSMIAGLLCYYISLKGGRPIVEKFIGKENIELVDVFIEKYGAPLIFIFRAIPFMAFDPISYVSGLVKIDVKKYSLATLLGSLIRCAFYAWLGASLIGVKPISEYSESEIDTLINSHYGAFNQILLILIVVLAGAYLLYQYVLVPSLRKKRDELVRQENEEKEMQSSSIPSRDSNQKTIYEEMNNK